MIKYISEFNEESSYQKINFILYFFFFLNIPIVIVISLGLLCYSNFISDILFSTQAHSNLIKIYTLALPLGLVSSIFDIYLKSIRKIRYYIIYSSLSSIVNFCAFMVMLYWLSYEGVIISIVLNYVFTIIIGCIILFKIGRFPKVSIRESVGNSIIKNILSIGLVMMILVSLQQASQLFMRIIIADELGIQNLGLYQSIFGISNNYFALFLSVLGTYSIPKISTHKVVSETVNEINQTLKLLIYIYSPAVVLCFVFRYYLIVTFYSSEFLGSSDLLFYQLLGDFTKALSWVFGLWLIPYMKIKLLFVFEVINNAIFLGLFYYLLKVGNLGLMSVSIAYFIAFAIHAIINFIFLKNRLNFHFSNRNFLILNVSIIVLIIAFLVSYINIDFGYYLFLPLLLIWSYICIQKKDINQLRLLVNGVVAAKFKKL